MLSIGDQLLVEVVSDTSKRCVFKAVFLKRDPVVEGMSSVRLFRVRNFSKLEVLPNFLYLLEVVDVSTSLDKTKDGRAKVYVDCNFLKVIGRFVARRKKTAY